MAFYSGSDLTVQEEVQTTIAVSYDGPSKTGYIFIKNPTTGLWGMKSHTFSSEINTSLGRGFTIGALPTGVSDLTWGLFKGEIGEVIVYNHSVTNANFYGENAKLLDAPSYNSMPWEWAESFSSGFSRIRSVNILNGYSVNDATDLYEKAQINNLSRFVDKNYLIEAIHLWFKNREYALELYGDIGDWDVSNMTDLNNLFSNILNKSSASFNYNATGMDIPIDLSSYFNTSTIGITGSNDRTIIVVINWTGTTVDKNIFTYGNTSTHTGSAFSLQIKDGGSLQLWINNTSIYSTIAVSPNVETIVGVSVDNKKEVHFYIKGVSEQEWQYEQVNSSHDLNTHSDNNFTLGDGFGGNHFDGTIGEVGIYNFATTTINSLTELVYSDGVNASNFNDNISKWNVSNVTNMSFLFENAYSFNQPIGNWNVSKVQYMNGMFSGDRLLIKILVIGM